MPMPPPDAAAALWGEPLGTRPPPMGEATLDPSVRGKTVLVVGDSWAGNLAEGMTAVASRGNRIVNAGLGGCGIMLPRTQGGQKPAAVCMEWPYKWPVYMKKFKPDAVLLRVGNWDLVKQSFEGSSEERNITDPYFRKHFGKQLDRAIDILTANGTPVYMTNIRLSEVEEYRVQTFAMNHALRSAAERNKHKGVHLLNFTRQMCNDSGCPVQIGTHSVFDETGHPAKWGRDRLAIWALNTMFADKTGRAAVAAR